MKKIRPLYAIGSLAITVSLCLLLWFVLHPKEMTPRTVYKTVTPESRTTQASQISTTSTPSAEQSQQHIAAKTEQAEPNTELYDFLEKLFSGPAYEEYRKSQEGVFGVDMNAWWDFMESQGLGSGRTLQNRDFQQLFPHGGTAADYEPEMRKKLAELAVADPTLDTVQLLGAFWKQDKANYIWTRQYFSGHVGDYDWADNIRQTAETLLAELTPMDAETDTAIPQPIPLFTTDTLTEHSKNTGVATDTELTPPTVTPAPENHPPQDIFDDPSHGPSLTTPADFQKTLQQRFSPQRINSAIRTLTQHGPADGLQRLKETDAELATHLERFIQQNKEPNEHER